jgi:hypothetical protein
MAIELTLTNIFQFIAALAPLILGFFMIMISVFNQDIKGIIYLAGILISTVINFMALHMIKHKRDDIEGSSEVCDLIHLPFNLSDYNIPSLNSVLLTFTFVYLIMPMVASNQMNYALIIFLSGMIVVDAISKIMNKCTNIGGVLIGCLLGGIMGAIWYIIFKAAGLNSLLYFNTGDNDKLYCSRPKNQTFKCAVYKNGEIIKTL